MQYGNNNFPVFYKLSNHGKLHQIHTNLVIIYCTLLGVHGGHILAKYLKKYKKMGQENKTVEDMTRCWVYDLTLLPPSLKTIYW